MNNISVVEQNTEIVNKINNIIDFYNIDKELFKRKLQERLLFCDIKDIEHKTSYLLAIIRAMVKEEKLENTRVRVDDKARFTIHDLCDEFRKLGFAINQDEVLFIDIVLQHIRKYNLLSVIDTRRWINKSLEYLVVNNKKSTGEFIMLFKNTQTMKNLNLNWEVIENESR